MTTEARSCPLCKSPHGYPDGSLWICPECFHEWTVSTRESTPTEGSEASSSSFRDANGAPLQDGDTVSVIKDLKAGKETIKAGTKVKNIRLLNTPVNGHDIACKIPGQGSMYLKCSVVKKVT